VPLSSSTTVACESRASTGLGGRFYGIYTGLVTDVQDPDGQGRVRVRLPWSPDVLSQEYEVWARLATLMAGAGRGTWFIPDVDDEVMIAFEAGDVRHPCVLGSVWNGQDAPPETMDSENNLKTIKSRSGVTIRITDTSGSVSLLMETPGGQSIELRDSGNEIELTDANGNTVKLESAGVTVTSSGKVSVQASTVEISAGSVTVNAGMSKFNGVVQADTVIATSVVGTSYTPGAGNIW
jgi:uncharacterized protein involved in type VI secretion and phage assembly